nr:MAG TPA: hypothetical protein [Caudoviricetes sp.]
MDSAATGGGVAGGSVKIGVTVGFAVRAGVGEAIAVTGADELPPWLIKIQATTTITIPKNTETARKALL